MIFVDARADVEAGTVSSEPVTPGAGATSLTHSLVSVFPGVLCISCDFVLIFYTIDEATCATMKRELEERRAGEA